MVVFDLLAIGGQIVCIGSVKVFVTDFGSIFFQETGNPVDGIFNHGHSLGPAKSAEGRIGWQIGFPRLSGDGNMRQIIGIVRMKHGPLKNGTRKVCCRTCI